MDVEDTPPSKRIKSEQLSRRASAEPAASHTAEARDTNDHGGAAAPVLQLHTEAGGSTVKEEHSVGGVLGSIADSGPAVSNSVQLETLPAAASASTFVVSPPSSEIASSQPVAKKKKPISSSTSGKKETSTSKNKKASSSKKAISHSNLESASSRRVKAELVSPTPPPVILPAEPEEEDEDNALYCICQRRQDDVEGGMIMCDRCDLWYHYRCMHITEDDAELVDQFICPPCHQVTGEKTTYKVGCARSGCRRAAMTPYSEYCSERCGMLVMTARMAGMRVQRLTEKAEGWQTDRRLGSGRKTEGFTNRSEAFEGIWKQVVGEQLEAGVAGAGSMQRLGLAGAFELIMKRADLQILPVANGIPNGTAEAPLNGSSASPAKHSPTHCTPISAGTSSATSLLGINEQIIFVATQILAIDLEKSRINARLDRLDLRSTLLHLVSDRVPTLPSIGSTDAAAEDEEMADASSSKSNKKKKSTVKSKSKTVSDTTGPRCGYDQRLHWDDAEFDAWSRTLPGSSILTHDMPLDGVLDDQICGLAKRKCRRHLDWSNLCELALDAEKAELNGDSRTLTQRKLELVERKRTLETQRDAVGELVQLTDKSERRRREEKDRDLALKVATQGSRRG